MESQPGRLKVAKPFTELINIQSQPGRVRGEKPFSKLINIQPQPGRVAIDKQVRKSNFESIKEAFQMLKNAKAVIKSLNGKKLENEKWICKTMKSGERRIIFNVESLDTKNREYLHKHLGEVLMMLLNSITYQSQWLCIYNFSDNKNICRKLNEETAGDLLQQLRKENFITEIESANSKIQEKDYDFFTTQIENLTSFTFFDLADYEGLTMDSIRNIDFKRKSQKDVVEEAFSKDKILQVLIKSGDQEAIRERMSEIYKIL